MRRHAAKLPLVLLLLCASLLAQNGITPGKLIEKVAVGDYSYALYLPSNYDSNRAWPSVFIFDPAARGPLAARKFIPGAEKYGYVLAASNDSRNGPTRIGAINAMFSDVMTRFKVDKRKTYLAGMSGGARVAITIANRCHDCPAGIFASAAGFNQQAPFEHKDMMFFGAAGIYDFNYPELFENNETLERGSTPHRFETFEGGHDWPPEDVVSAGLAWFRLQEMVRGITPISPDLVNALYTAQLSKAAQLESHGQIYLAYRAYKQLAADFTRFLDVSEAQKHYHALKDRKEIKAGYKLERTQFSEQQALEAPIISFMQSLVNGTSEPEAHGAAISAAADLLKQARTEKNPAHLVPIRRALDSIRIAAFESANSLRPSDVTGRRKLYQIALATQPDSPQLLYNLACLHSLEGNRREAMRLLRSSIAHGFKDYELMKSDPDLNALRKDPGFDKLIPAGSR